MLKVKLALLVALISVISPLSIAYADDFDNTTTTDTTTTTPDSTTATDSSDPATKRAERIAEYKQKLADKLTEAQTKRLTARCKSAQGLVTSYHAKLNNVIANRKKVYQEIGEKLDNLIVKLQAAGLDTTELETARDDIKKEAQALSDSLDSYDTVLSDLEAMDCESDPEAFKAALEDARTVQQQLRDQATEFRRFATTELKAIIQKLRDQLEQKQQETNSTDSTNNEGGTQ